MRKLLVIALLAVIGLVALAQFGPSLLFGG